MAINKFISFLEVDIFPSFLIAGSRFAFEEWSFLGASFLKLWCIHFYYFL